MNQMPVKSNLLSCRHICTKLNHSKMSLSLYWGAEPVPFHQGETIAAALMRAGVNQLGQGAGGVKGRYFCGIGNCQACLVSVNGASLVEACLTPAQDGMRLTSAPQGSTEVQSPI